MVVNQLMEILNFTAKSQEVVLIQYLEENISPKTLKLPLIL